RARAAVAASALALAVASAVLVGPGGLIEYFTAVLPAHADAELYFPFQYSLSWLLGSLGVAAGAAKLAGTASYIAFSAVGLMLAKTTSVALRRRELLVFVPALSSLVGGRFLHQEELCFAIPALAIFSIAARGRSRVVAAAALCIVALPWLLVWPTKGLFLASIFVCAVILIRLRIDLRIAVPILAVVAAAIFALQSQPPMLWPPPPGSEQPVYAANELAQDSWVGYINSLNGVNLSWLYVKIPTWIALLAALGVASYCSRRGPELA
ncbi:MAG TPA: hypothetical protein VMU38_06070, partial [Candidatus Binatia bacterium]|nr:hypothetical protein [Candidatus Binatia bacterium]